MQARDRHPVQHLRLVETNDALNGSHLLAIPSTQPLTTLMLAVATSPHGFVATITGEIGLVPEASHRGIASPACSDRVRRQNSWSFLKERLLSRQRSSKRSTILE